MLRRLNCDLFCVFVYFLLKHNTQTDKYTNNIFTKQASLCIQTQIIRQNIVSSLLPKKPSCPILTNSLFPLPKKGFYHSGFYSHRSILPIFVLYIDGIRQYILFHVGLLFFNIMFGRDIHAVVCNCVSFILCCIVSHCMNILKPFTVNGLLGSFQLLLLLMTLL